MFMDGRTLGSSLYPRIFRSGDKNLKNRNLKIYKCVCVCVCVCVSEWGGANMAQVIPGPLACHGVL